MSEKKDTNHGRLLLFRNYACHTLEDFDNMDKREKVFFKVSPEDRKIQEDVIIPYWKDRALMTRMNKLLPKNGIYYLIAGLYTEFLMQRGPGHTVADGKIYKRGYKDCIKEIQAEINALDFNQDVDALKEKRRIRRHDSRPRRDDYHG